MMTSRAAEGVSYTQEWDLGGLRYAHKWTRLTVCRNRQQAERLYDERLDVLLRLVPQHVAKRSKRAMFIETTGVVHEFVYVTQDPRALEGRQPDEVCWMSGTREATGGVPQIVARMFEKHKRVRARQMIEWDSDDEED